MPLFFWAGLFVLTVIIEIAGQQLISIWFAAGALVAFIAACFHGSDIIQIVLFLAVSILLLIFTRPLTKKILSFGIKNTNRQEIGKIGTVIQPIDPLTGTGRVRLDGVDWIAVSKDGIAIPVHACVRIEAVDGTKLLVSQPLEVPVSNHKS
jgi:membrane protein implicated in regulation of membrane protease activity